MVVFSTIIPTFNRSRFIEATLETLLGQDSSKPDCDDHEINDHEIIVVDDGSTDDTLEVLAKYGNRIKILQQNNKGPGAARNLGIRHALGKYITFLDSDDLWFPWTLETFRQVVRACDSPSFIAGTPFIFQEEANVYAIKPTLLDVMRFKNYYETSHQNVWILPSATAIRADILHQVGGFTNRCINGEDSDLWLKLGTCLLYTSRSSSFN
jgi:glycosyltransferase involved in cell wall biosynthesis